MTAVSPVNAPRLRVMFFGTPNMAIPALEALIQSQQFEVVAVVTQTDKPSGRGQKLQPSPVKSSAESQGIKIFQPKSLKNKERADGLFEFLQLCGTLDYLVVVAYGKIIPKELLDFPKFGAVNIHFSLLPRWRGAAPVQRAILAGDSETGISIMKMDEGLDTGPVYLVEHLPITAEDTSGTLSSTLAERGAKLLPDALQKIASGNLQANAQAEAEISYAEKLKPEDFQIDWKESAARIHSRVQGAAPAPGARTTYGSEMVKIFAVHSHPSLGYASTLPGTVVECNNSQLIVATGNGEYIAVQEMQFPNRKRLSVSEIMKSRKFEIGSRFGE